MISASDGKREVTKVMRVCYASGGAAMALSNWAELARLSGLRMRMRGLEHGDCVP